MSSASPDETTADVEVRALAAERLTFFADAVIAIAITLLALELPPPSGSTNAELLHSANEHRSEYIAFLISFIVVGAHWRAHHRLFRYVTSIDGVIVRLSLGWLLMQILTPFATKLISGEGAFQTRFVFYASVQVVSMGLFMLMTWEIRRRRLYRDDMPPGMFARVYGGSSAMLAGFAVSIPIAFLTEWTYVCWIVIPPAMNLLLRAMRQRQSGE
jgi:uncharacterized membrane protein